MEILNEIRLLNKHNKQMRFVYENSILLNDLFTDVISENDLDNKEVIEKIKNNDYIINDYEEFLKSLYSGKRSGYLSKYTIEELKEKNITTYQVRGENIGFALKPDKNDLDIISVHNNSPYKGIGDELMKSIISLGGNKLDHFDGYLSDYYSKHGFKEYDRFKWDDQYKPIDWDKNDGKPDVILRKL